MAFGTQGTQRGQFRTVSALALLAGDRLTIADNDKKIEIYRLPPVQAVPGDDRRLPSVTLDTPRSLHCTLAYRVADGGVWCFDADRDSGHLLDTHGKIVTTLLAKSHSPVAVAFGAQRIAVIDPATPDSPACWATERTEKQHSRQVRTLVPGGNAQAQGTPRAP